MTKTGIFTPRRAIVRRAAGMWALEDALRRQGFSTVAGVDEAGRGACAGPLVVAACILPTGRRGQIPDLADSKLLTPLARDRIFDDIQRRALATSVVIIPSTEVDAQGLHVCNVEGMRRALATLPIAPKYALTDGFPVTGLGLPSLAVWKGDQVAACVAAASILAKVTRDRLMVELHSKYPQYGFDAHKGYVTAVHESALRAYGPCAAHRYRFGNVAMAAAAAEVREHDKVKEVMA